MRTKLFILLLIIKSLLLAEVDTLNKRAFDTLVTDPSSSVLMADKAIDSNKDPINREEYLKSLYYKSMAYGNIYEDGLKYLELNKAWETIVRWDYSFSEMGFYILYIETLIEREDYQGAIDIIENESVKRVMDQRELIILQLLKSEALYRSDGQDITGSLNNIITAVTTFDYLDLLPRIYLFYGDYIRSSDNSISLDFYNKAIELDDDYYSIKALVEKGILYREWGSLYKSVEILELAYLKAQSREDYDLILQVLDALIEGYKIIGYNKKLSRVLESKIYILDKRSEFLIHEYRDLGIGEYYITKLRDEVKESRFLNELLLKGIIILIGLVIAFIIVLLIQAYRLRHLKIGEH